MGALTHGHGAFVFPQYGQFSCDSNQTVTVAIAAMFGTAVPISYLKSYTFKRTATLAQTKFALKSGKVYYGTPYKQLIGMLSILKFPDFNANYTS